MPDMPQRYGFTHHDPRIQKMTYGRWVKWKHYEALQEENRRLREERDMYQEAWETHGNHDGQCTYLHGYDKCHCGFHETSKKINDYEYPSKDGE